MKQSYIIVDRQCSSDLIVGVLQVCVVLRFALPHIDFVLVRFFFSLTLILFYLRLLRLGYIITALGPRIITIRAMVRTTQSTCMMPTNVEISEILSIFCIP